MNQDNNSPLAIQDNIVVTMDYVLTVDGEIIDRSDDSGPIQFLQGFGQIVPGLETALYGMAVGESKRVLVVPEDGYGVEDDAAYAEIPKSEFPAEVPLELGVELQLKDQDGDIFDAYIEEVRENTVLLNFNHRLAGKALDFSVTVVDLRLASAEELDHGHVH